jgi:group I intron endonuclease
MKGGEFMTCGIYILKNINNGKVYVGQSIDIENRFNDHFKSLRNNNHTNKYLQAVYNKYGEDIFECGIIEVCDENELDDREIYWISYLNSNDNQYGYNLTIGGDGTRGYVYTEEVKKKMSQKMKQIFSNPLNRERVRQQALRTHKIIHNRPEVVENHSRNKN